jgi:hypothetical protein
MKRYVLTVSNAALFLAACLLVGTGLLMEFRLDEGEAASILGLSGDDWGEIHFIMALTCTAIALLHVLLNWKWVAGQFNHRKGLAAGLPLVAAVIIIGGMLILPSSQGKGASQEQHQQYGDRDD